MIFIRKEMERVTCDFYPREVKHDADELANAAGDGNLEEVIDVAEDSDLDKNYALVVACMYGHLNVAQYLLDSGANVHVLDYTLLRRVCLYGYLDIFQWICQEGYIDIRTTADEYFRLACQFGHRHIVEWIESL